MKSLIGLVALGLLLQSCSTPGPLEKKITERKSAMMKDATPEKKEIGAKFAKATKELKESGIEEKALKKGVKAPNFKLGKKKFSKFYSKKVTVLKFYRGHWCPYCVLELKEYQAMKDQFDQAGAQIIAISPDKWKYIKKTKRDHKITFPIYRDRNHKIAKKFGTTFKVDKEVLKIYKKFKINLRKSQGNKMDTLALPGTYVVDQDGVIQYAFYDVDYTKRAEPTEVLNIVKSLKK